MTALPGLKLRFLERSLEACNALEPHLQSLAGSVALLQQTTTGINAGGLRTSLLAKVSELQECYISLRDAIEELEDPEDPVVVP